jgi:DNA-binding transcriptional LysR family regulator
MLCWDDIRFFLSVARTGSTLAAGRALKVSQTTAARRVAALEDAVGVSLFERRQAGYALTDAGQGLLNRAETMERAAGGFARRGGAGAGAERGAATTVEVYATTCCPAAQGAADGPSRHPHRARHDRSGAGPGGGEADVDLSVGSPAGRGGRVGRGSRRIPDGLLQPILR